MSDQTQGGCVTNGVMVSESRMTQNPPKTASGPESLRTFKQAAEELGLPYWKVQRAARWGLLPTYRLVNGRRYVRLSDILERMSGD